MTFKRKKRISVRVPQPVNKSSKKRQTSNGSTTKKTQQITTQTKTKHIKLPTITTIVTTKRMARRAAQRRAQKTIKLKRQKLSQRVIKNHMSSLELLSVAQRDLDFPQPFMKKVLKSYLKDKSKFQIIEKFAVLKLNELHATIQLSKVPNKIRTAIVCDLFHNLLHNDEKLKSAKSSKIMNKIEGEIYNLIFEKYNNKILNENDMIVTTQFFLLQPHFVTYYKMQERANRLRVIAKITEKGKRNFRYKHTEKLVGIIVIFHQWKSLTVMNSQRRKEHKKLMNKSNHHRCLTILSKYTHRWKLLTERNVIKKLKYKVRSNLRDINGIEASNIKSMQTIDNIRHYIKKYSQKPLNNVNDFSAIYHNKKKKFKVKELFLNVCNDLKILKNKLTCLLINDKHIDSSLLLTNKEENINIQQLVIRWVNYHLSHVEKNIGNIHFPQRINNLTTDFDNLIVFFLLLHRIKKCELNLSMISKCYHVNKRKIVVNALYNELKEFIPTTFFTERDLLIGQYDIIYAIIICLMIEMPCLEFIDTSNAKKQIENINNKVDHYIKVNKNIDFYLIQVEALKFIYGKGLELKTDIEDMIDEIETSHNVWIDKKFLLLKELTTIISASIEGQHIWINFEANKSQRLKVLPLQKLSVGILHPPKDFLLMKSLSLTEQKHIRLTDIRLLQFCEEIIEKYYTKFFQLYRHYCRVNPSIKKMHIKDVKKMLKDFGFKLTKQLINKLFKYSQMSTIEYYQTIYDKKDYKKLNLFQESKSKIKCKRQKDFITFNQWLELLIRISHAKYKIKKTSKNNVNSVSQHLQLFINSTITSKKFKTADNFRNDLIIDEEVVELLKFCQYQLRQAFRYYIKKKNDKSTKQPKTMDKINKSKNKKTAAREELRLPLDLFIVMMRELTLISGAIDKKLIGNLWIHVNNEDHILIDLRNDQTYVSDGVTFQGFIRLLLALAIHKRPDPHISNVAKMKKFLKESIILPLSAKKDL